MNRFTDAENMAQLMRQVVGAGSVCWTDDKIFDDEQAVSVARAATARAFELVSGDLNFDQLSEQIKEIIDRSATDRPFEEGEEILEAVSRHVHGELGRNRRREHNALQGLMRATRLARDLASMLEEVSHRARLDSPPPSPEPPPHSTGFNSGSM